MPMTLPVVPLSSFQKRTLEIRAVVLVAKIHTV